MFFESDFLKYNEGGKSPPGVSLIPSQNFPLNISNRVERWLSRTTKQ